MKDVSPWLVGMAVLFYAAGIAVAGYGAWAVRRSAAVGTWPTVPGTIVRCDLQTKEGGGGDGDDAGPVYQTVVRYTYAVNGRNYTGDRVAFGYDAGGVLDDHVRLCDRLRSAKAGAVRYDPADPATSALTYGLSRSAQMTLAFACTWLMMCVAFTGMWWLSTRPNDVLARRLVVR